MSRHRNVRSLNYEEDFYDEDDAYGHSIEDNYCISPATAAQFTFNRERNVDLSNFMGEEGGIPEEDEEGEDVESTPDTTPREGHRSSLDYTRPKLSDIDEAKLNSCLEEIHNVLGESIPEHILVDTIVRNNFSIETSLNELLSQQADAPKPQRVQRPKRRNQSQAVKDESAPPLEMQSARVTGPTVILQTPKPRNSITESTQSFAQVSVTDGSADVAKNRTATVTNNRTKAVTESVPSSNSKPQNVKPAPSGASTDRTANKSNSVTSENDEQNTIQKDLLLIQETYGNKGDKDLSFATPEKKRVIPPLPRSSSKSKPDKFDLKEEFKKRQGGKDMINLVVIGHVDAGKSTLMGHLLYQLGNVNQRVMHKYEQEAKKLGKSSFAYAWVLDETEEERVRGVTMDIAQTKFETPNKIITLLDAPGHKDFIPNMITGTAQADVAILVVNATNGEFETGFESGGQTREHALLARSLGVSQIIVVINKMDTVHWQQTRYDEVVRRLGAFLKQVGFREGDTSFIPVSGLCGENLTRAVKEPLLLAWYKGNTLVEQIDKFKPVVRAVDKPLRVTVSDVFKGMGSGLTVTGKVASGSVQVYDRVLVMPTGEYAAVKGISINEEAVSFAFAGDHVSMVITGVDITHIGVGSVLCDPQSPVACAARIQARVVLFNLEIPMTRGFTVIFHYQSVTQPAIVKKLVSTLNKSTGEVIKNKPKCLMKNTSAVIEIEFERPVCVELYKDNKELGRFMLRYGGHTIAAGLIEEVLKTKTGDTETLGATTN